MIIILHNYVDSINRIFHQLYSFGPFIERLPAGSRSCDELLERCTLIVVAKWFLEQYAELFMQVGSTVIVNSAHCNN